MLAYLLLACVVATIALLVCPPLWRRRQRRVLAARPFPADWHRLLEHKWLLYRYLPREVQSRLQQQLQVMMAETVFYGCNGLSVTPDMRLLILAQAALVSAHVPLQSMPVVLLYPEAFVREGDVVDELGLVARERSELLGESWDHGRVVLSWANIAQDLGQLRGHNLVIHEYSHQLDSRDGSMNGVPPLASPGQYQRWTAAMQAAYDDLCRHLETDAPPEIDAYAATNPEEFFAVTCEYFFTAPARLYRVYPEVYRQLADYFSMEPRHWGMPELEEEDPYRRHPLPYRGHID